MKQVLIHILISGKLQGFNFRYNAQQQAIELGLTGFVRKLKGSHLNIEIKAQGDEEKTDQMLNWCQDEPHSDQISNILYRFDKPNDSYSDFIVR